MLFQIQLVPLHRDDQAKRQSLPEFGYDFYLFKFGLQEFAEMHLAGLLRVIEDHLDDPRIALFGALCGHVKCDEEFPEECTHYTMMYLSHLLTLTDGPEPSEVGLFKLMNAVDLWRLKAPGFNP